MARKGTQSIKRTVDKDDVALYLIGDTLGKDACGSVGKGITDVVVSVKSFALYSNKKGSFFDLTGIKRQILYDLRA
jgi:hypothetical protein